MFQSLDRESCPSYLHCGVLYIDALVIFGGVEKENSERKRKWKFNVEIFSLFYVKMIQIWTFTAALSTDRVPSLAKRVAYLGYLINLRLFNWRVPALISRHNSLLCPNAVKAL